MGDKLSPITLAAAKKSSGGGDTKRILEEIKQTPVEAGGETLSTIDEKLNYLIEKSLIPLQCDLLSNDTTATTLVRNTTSGSSIVIIEASVVMNRFGTGDGSPSLSLAISGGDYTILNSDDLNWKSPISSGENASAPILFRKLRVIKKSTDVNLTITVTKSGGGRNSYLACDLVEF